MSIPVYTLKLVTHRVSRFAKREIIYDGTKESVLPLLRKELAGVTQEHHAVLTLDHRNQVTGFAITGIGGLTEVSASVREIFKFALAANAAFIIAVHTHPGRDASPSEEDRKTYKELFDAGCNLGILLADDLILAANGRAFSFNEDSTRAYRKERKMTRDKAAARSARKIAAGRGCARDVVLVSATALAELPSLIQSERVATLQKVIDDLTPIVTTGRRIWFETRERAKFLLSYSTQVKPDIERGHFPDIERLSQVLSFQIDPPHREPKTPLTDFAGLEILRTNKQKGAIQ